jgi:hypothetical protein
MTEIHFEFTGGSDAPLAQLGHAFDSSRQSEHLEEGILRRLKLGFVRLAELIDGRFAGA